MYADLHLHSTHSDGTDTPEELLTLARENGVSVVAITDHDSVSGVESLGGLRSIAGVRVIPAIEISGIVNRKPLHILGYYIDTQSLKLADFLARMAREKTENTRVIFEHARAKGVFDYAWERVVQISPGQPRLSGIHVMKAMDEDRYVVPGMTTRELFRKYFLPSGEGFIETGCADGHEAVDIVKAAGGIPVIAHPKSVGDDAKVLDLLDYGAQGLEVYHPSHTPKETQKYLALATERNLYITGGSDWHGGNNRPETTHFAVTGLADPDYPILNARNAFA